MQPRLLPLLLLGYLLVVVPYARGCQAACHRTYHQATPCMKLQPSREPNTRCLVRLRLLPATRALHACVPRHPHPQPRLQLRGICVLIYCTPWSCHPCCGMWE
jgi:hypothetical protein